MKYLLIVISAILIYLIPDLVFSSDESNYSNNSSPLTITNNSITNNSIIVSVLFGQFSINTNTYNTLRLLPEFNFWEISLGLDINYDFDVNGNFRITEWNSWQAILSKIQNFSIGTRDDPVFIKIGDIDDFTLGDGFIFNRYTDMLNYPAVNMRGFIFDLNFNYFGIESMADNILLWDILGIRAFIRPFIDDYDSILSNLEIGLTFGTDLNNQNMFPSPLTPYLFTYNTNSYGEVMIYGADIGLTFINKEYFSLKGFADVALIQNMGSGESVGLSGFIIQAIPYSLSLRILQPEFLPEFFDTFYEISRSYKYQNLGLLSNNISGFTGSTGITLVSNEVSINFQYESYFSDEINPSMLVSFELSKDFLKLIGFKFSFERQNFVGINDLFYNYDGNSSFIITLDYYIMDNLKVSVDFEENYELSSAGLVQPYTYIFVSTFIRF